MSLAAILPKPKNTKISKWETQSDEEKEVAKPKKQKTLKKHNTIPPYGHRKDFLPVHVQDFLDGGAFPEIKMVQYPLDMGRSKTSDVGRSKLALHTDAEGNIRYDMILHQHKAQGKILHSTIGATIEKDLIDNALEIRPDDSEFADTSHRTKEAIEKIVLSKIKISQPKQAVANGNDAASQDPEFIRYTPQQTEQSNGVSTRIIRMGHVHVDPFEPPKFTHRRIARPPGSPPAPVLHSPPRKVTLEERQAWMIPPCISNWKNAKWIIQGYTIPLDKRLAADGRGIQDVQINDNFAKLAEALYVADRHVREEVKIRSEMQTKLSSKEKIDKEEKLRQLAQKARDDRAGIIQQASDNIVQPHKRVVESDQESRSDSQSPVREQRQKRRGDDYEIESSDKRRVHDDDESVRERDQIRRQREKEREREMKRLNSDSRLKSKTQLGDRDISEKIALGVVQPNASKDSMFDQRLFNQSAGMSSGFSHEEAYNIYDKPLFAGSSANILYRAKGVDQDSVAGVDTEGIEDLLSDKPHKSFSGTDNAGLRQGPVQFEKEESDPFGFEQFLTDAKKGRDKTDQPKRGAMHTSFSGKREEYDDKTGGRNIGFQKGRNE